MYKGVRGYLYKGATVVLNKSDINNAKEEDYKEVMIYISNDFIKESAEEIELMVDEEDDCY